VSDLPPEYIAELQARDTRFSVLAEAIAVETDLRDNVTIRALMGAIRQDADQAMEDLAETSPNNTESISLHLVKIRTLVYVRRTLDSILKRGHVAEQAIRADDEVNADA
jgi:hypothetical protein